MERQLREKDDELEAQRREITMSFDEVSDDVRSHALPI